VWRPPPTQGPFGRDFEAYYAAGAVWDAGGDPWSRAVWTVERTIPGVAAGRDELLPYVGPAAALPLFGALARLPFAFAVRLWTGLLAAALGVLVLAALALTGTRDVRVLLAAFALALFAGPTTSDLGLGQAALLSAGGIAVALFANERRAVVPAALATLIAAVQPNLALVLAARLRDARALGATALGFAAFAGLTLLAAPDVATYLGRLIAHGAAERFVAIQYTPAAIAWDAGAPAVAASAIGLACAAAALAVLVFLTVRARLRPLDGTLLALAALPFAVPFFHEHDFVVELLPLVILGVRARGAARVWAGIAAVLALTEAFGLAQRPGAQAAILAQGLAVATAFVALGSGRAQRVDVAPFAALALLALVAIPLAQRAPAPVWPDALGPTYQAPASADASTVWADEQRTAGLTVQQPAWGVLRAFPLLGCLALGTALVLAAREREPA
jgi:hypothetical protein